MKKIFPTLLMVILFAAAAAWPAAASSVVIKGEITGIDMAAGKITLQTSDSIGVSVTIPDGFDLATLQLGEEVIVRGHSLEDGSIKADMIKPTGQEDGSDEAAGGGRAFCSSGKKQVPHPMATKIAEKYGVSSGWVMSYYCKGFSMGAIMLAIKTSQVSESSADELLNERSNGNGWGQIWQSLNLIGNGNADKIPPGQAKKPEKTPKPNNGHH